MEGIHGWPHDVSFENLQHLVLRFGKALTQKPLQAGEPEPFWIALGYFDTLQIYPLPMEDSGGRWIQATYQEDLRIAQTLNGQFYFHPVHLTACDEEDPLHRVQFFLRDTAYLAVTFVQAYNTDVLALKAQIRQALPQSSQQLSWVCYHTLNLSDAVILWKSDGLMPILKAIRTLYYLPQVGDLRTVPAVFVPTLLQGCDAPTPQEEVLPLVLTRYLVRSAHWAGQYFLNADKSWQETPFITSGMEDLSTVSRELPAQALLEHLRARLINQKLQDIFTKAFLESEIHLGVQEEDVPPEPPQESPLTARCEALLADFLRLPAHRHDGNQDWIKVATELFNALPDMSRSAVSDGFCYLILESAALFCREMTNLSQPDSYQIRFIQRFLRGWGTLMEQSMRQDGKLSQQPGYSPALCQIPASLLELYLAFHAECCQVLQKLALDDAQFSFLLVPKLCRRIKVEVTIQKAPPCNRLLYVDIPYALLYEPEQVLPHLCHEISHFCGERWRNRTIRKTHLTRVCAKVLAATLQLYHPAAEETIEELLRQGLEDSALFLDPLFDAICNEAVTLLLEEDKLQLVLQAAQWSTSDSQTSLLKYHAQLLETLAIRQEIIEPRKANEDHPNHLFFSLTREYKYLFRECYADISMLFLLGLDMETYFRLIRNELKLMSRCSNLYQNYDLTVERWAVVSHVVYHADENSLHSLASEELLRRFVRDVHLCYSYFFDDQKLDADRFEEAMYRFHPPACIAELTAYLRACRASMKASCALDPLPLTELRDVFHQIAWDEKVFGASCRKLVEKYRVHLLYPLPDAVPTPVGV